MVDVRESLVEVGQPPRPIMKVLYRLRTVDQILNSVQPGIDLMDIRERRAQPPLQQAPAERGLTSVNIIEQRVLLVVVDPQQV